jgi:hypothetical protein
MAGLEQPLAAELHHLARAFEAPNRRRADRSLQPWDAVWGMRYAEVKDPDGNVVDVFADLS